MNNHNSIVYYRFTVNNLRKHNTKDNTIHYGYLLNITQKNDIQRIVLYNLGILYTKIHSKKNKQKNIILIIFCKQG